ncbi:envelope stress response membrane protein PspC [Glaciecola sp. MH2013]|uniref:envelope stress response membrane protein PspC n=1 Tax=Glaciecola sp. MH2013 TaxID=2785524 RepID=UPI00189E4E69|nr:envelope stress response membrane protein PspC [Glaciecola sp. MH2013]MBF7072426.1 envelope stress response membrane protein PspC [Glaciecola sp. MH2013]
MRSGGTLYRDPKNGRIAGVCAGVAEYFKLETWLVRILTVTAFFLMAGPFVIVTYVAAWFILDKKPSDYDLAGQQSTDGDENVEFVGWRVGRKSASASSQGTVASKVEVKSRVWQAGEPPKQAFHDIQQRFRVAESRLRKLEGYVTSKEFQINREISRL